MVPLVIGIAVAILSFALFGCPLVRTRRRKSPDGLPPPGQGSGEQRRFARCTKNTVRVFSQLGAEERLQEGWIIDRSAEGVGLILVLCQLAPAGDPPAPGSMVEVKPTNAPGDCPWVRLEVRHVRREAGYWHIGGKLLDAITTEHLPHFGHEPPREAAARTATVWERAEWRGGAYPITGFARVVDTQPNRENAKLAS
jgi:hypothetical protein